MLKRLLSTKLNEYVSPDVAVLLLRIGAAALIMTHGIPKLMRILDGNFNFGDPLGLGPTLSLILVTFAEAFCAILVLMGLFTRVALIPLIINMTVIVFVAHADDPFGRKELPLLFLINFIVLFFTGPGKYSLDKKLFGK
jgi:putative oxidoreductase